MSEGKLKWFRESIGLGFTEKDDGGDVFVHYNLTLTCQFRRSNASYVARPGNVRGS